MSNNFKNRFFITNKLTKPDCINLLERFELEELVKIIDISGRDALINLISQSHSRSQLHSLIYSSSLTDKVIYDIIYKEKIIVKDEPLIS